MIYEVLKSKGRGFEKGRKGPGGSSQHLIIKYKVSRPAQYAGYESVFKGTPDEMMDWLRPRQKSWGVVIEDKKKPKDIVRTVFRALDSITRPELESKPSNIWKWVAGAVAAAAAAGAAYLYVS